MRLSRRSFVLLLTGSIAAFVLWVLRRSEITGMVRDFFAFDNDAIPWIAKYAEVTRVRRPAMYFASFAFFSLSLFGAGILIPRVFRIRVLRYWGDYLLGKPGIVRPYLHYPSAGESLICNGLIRSKIA